jgi:hypothetical protein
VSHVEQVEQLDVAQVHGEAAHVSHGVYEQVVHAGANTAVGA